MIADFEDLYNDSVPSSDISPEIQDEVFNVSTLQQREYWRSIMPPDFTPTMFAPRLKRTQLTSSGGRHGVWCKNIRGGPIIMGSKAKQSQITTNSLYLAAWASTQARFSGSSEVMFGLWQSGRSASIPGIENLAFPCLNIVPMRVQATCDSDLKHLATLIQADLTKRDHNIEQSSLLDIDTWVNGQGRPLCNVSVNINRRPSKVTESDNSLLLPLEVPYKPPAPLDLELSGPCRIAELVKVICTTYLLEWD